MMESLLPDGDESRSWIKEAVAEHFEELDFWLEEAQDRTSELEQIFEHIGKCIQGLKRDV